jgi:hypothetical protein
MKTGRTFGTTGDFCNLKWKQYFISSAYFTMETQLIAQLAIQNVSNTFINNFLSLHRKSGQEAQLNQIFQGIKVNFFCIVRGEFVQFFVQFNSRFAILEIFSQKLELNTNLTETTNLGFTS